MKRINLLLFAVCGSLVSHAQLYVPSTTLNLTTNTPTGNVGIGTSTPATKLDVLGGINVQSNNNLTWGGVYGAGVPTITGVTSSGFYFYPAGSTSGASMRINAAGNVGIGTQSPNAKLQIHGNGAGTTALSIIENQASGSGAHFLSEGSNNIKFQLVRTSDGVANTELRTAGNSYLNAVSGNVGIRSNSPANTLQIGPNMQGWSGNDLVVSNASGGLAISNDVSSAMLYGDRDIALRPGFGKWSVYAKGSNGYVGVGHNAPTSMLHVLQSSNTDWASAIYNTAGSGKGLLVKSASGAEISALQVQDNNGVTRFNVNSSGNGWIAGKLGVGIATPAYPLESKGDFNLEDGGTNMDLRVRLHQKAALASYNTQNSSNSILFINRDWASGVSYHSDFDIVSLYGNVGIGTETPGSYKLAVEGKIGAREVNVTMAAWPDYVFKDNYQLRPLAEVQQFISENHHLPEVPSEKEVLANGQNLGEMNAILLKKIEELTLYVLEQEKRIKELEKLK